MELTYVLKLPSFPLSLGSKLRDNGIYFCSKITIFFLLVLFLNVGTMEFTFVPKLPSFPLSPGSKLRDNGTYFCSKITILSS